MDFDEINDKQYAAIVHLSWNLARTIENFVSENS